MEGWRYTTVHTGELAKAPNCKSVDFSVCMPCTLQYINIHNIITQQKLQSTDLFVPVCRCGRELYFSACELTTRDNAYGYG